MANKIDQLIRKYAKDSDLIIEQPDLPPLPDIPGPAGAPQPSGPSLPVDSPPPDKETKVVELAPEALVTAVKTMIELLSYGLHAGEDAVHRDPIAKWLKTKNEIDDENAWDVLDEINDFLATEDLSS